MTNIDDETPSSFPTCEGPRGLVSTNSSQTSNFGSVLPASDGQGVQHASLSSMTVRTKATTVSELTAPSVHPRQQQSVLHLLDPDAKAFPFDPKANPFDTIFDNDKQQRRLLTTSCFDKQFGEKMGLTEEKLKENDDMFTFPWDFFWDKRHSKTQSGCKEVPLISNWLAPNAPVYRGTNYNDRRHLERHMRLVNPNACVEDDDYSDYQAWWMEIKQSISSDAKKLAECYITKFFLKLYNAVNQNGSTQLVPSVGSLTDHKSIRKFAAECPQAYELYQHTLHSVKNSFSDNHTSIQSFLLSHRCFQFSHSSQNNCIHVIVQTAFHNLLRVLSKSKVNHQKKLQKKHLNVGHSSNVAASSHAPIQQSTAVTVGSTTNHNSTDTGSSMFDGDAGITFDPLASTGVADDLDYFFSAHDQQKLFASPAVDAQEKITDSPLKKTLFDPEISLDSNQVPNESSSQHPSPSKIELKKRQALMDRTSAPGLSILATAAGVQHGNAGSLQHGTEPRTASTDTSSTLIQSTSPHNSSTPSAGSDQNCPADSITKNPGGNKSVSKTNTSQNPRGKKLVPKKKTVVSKKKNNSASVVTTPPLPPCPDTPMCANPNHRPSCLSHKQVQRQFVRDRNHAFEDDFKCLSDVGAKQYFKYYELYDNKCVASGPNCLTGDHHENYGQINHQHWPKIWYCHMCVIAFDEGRIKNRKEMTSWCWPCMEEYSNGGKDLPDHKKPSALVPGRRSRRPR